VKFAILIFIDNDCNRRGEGLVEGPEFESRTTPYNFTFNVMPVCFWEAAGTSSPDVGALIDDSAARKVKTLRAHAHFPPSKHAYIFHGC
jgi:hypothetical protein